MGLLHLAPPARIRSKLLLQNRNHCHRLRADHLPMATVPSCNRFSQIGGPWRRRSAARLLQNNLGGKGILLGGIPGVPPAEVVIIGAGMAGTCAARPLPGMGAHVTVLDTQLWTLWERQ